MVYVINEWWQWVVQVDEAWPWLGGLGDAPTDPIDSLF